MSGGVALLLPVGDFAYGALQLHQFDPFLQSLPPRFEQLPRAPAPGRPRVMLVGGSTARLSPSPRTSDTTDGWLSN